MDHRDLFTLLKSLPTMEIRKEVELITRFVPQFARLLGYDASQTFYEYKSQVGVKFRADVVFSKSIEHPPWLVLEIKGSARPPVPDQWVNQLQSYKSAFNTPTAVLVSPQIIIVITDGGERIYDLNALTSDQVADLFELLGRNSQAELPERPVTPTELVQLIERVERAETNAAKGKSLEALANFLLTGVPGLRCKYSNLRTRSSEIDLVVEYVPSLSRLSLFDEVGQYALVECKNWSRPVGADQVRNFMAKLDKCKARLGIIFAKNGITGEADGTAALREIQSYFDREGKLVLVFSLQELRPIGSGREFYDVLDLKADNLRFDLGY